MFKRHDVLRKHLREACKGSIEPQRRKRQRTLEPTLLVEDAAHVTPSDLQMTLAPAMSVEAPTPITVLPARAESALGLRNPVSTGWATANNAESMDDIFGWLFDPDQHVDTTVFSQPTDLTSVLSSISAINPVAESVHPFNVRNQPLRPMPSFGKKDDIPVDWSLPTPKVFIDETARRSMLDIYEVSQIPPSLTIGTD